MPRMPGWLTTTFAGLVGYVTLSCHPNNPDQALFHALSAEQTGVTFTNLLTPNNSVNILEYNYFYNGGGVAAADFNRDGWMDLYFTGNQVSSRLYLNAGRQTDSTIRFTDVTRQAGAETAGWCTGVAVADVNADGWPDLYVCHAGLCHTPNQLFINQGRQPDGQVRFVEQADAYGLDYSGFSTQAAFLDYDRDGDLDMYLLTHYHDKTNPNYPKPKTPGADKPTADRLYRNDGNHFTDVSASAGITAEGLGLGVVVSDLNEDGWPDLYVTNDFAFDDALYLNNRDGTFTERLHQAVGHTSRFAMGCDVADYNNDGHPDIFTADMWPSDNARQKRMADATTNTVFNLSLQNGYLPQYSRNCLQLNDGLGGTVPSFSEIGQLAGVEATDWSWSALFADLDNDGLKDLYITNGIPHDITDNDFVAYRREEINRGTLSYPDLIKTLLAKVETLPPVDQPNVVFRNRGNLMFDDQSQAWGLNQPGFSNGVAYADLDNDGDLDLVVNNLNTPASILKNRTRETLRKHYLTIQLVGQGIGAKLRVVANGRQQVFEHSLQRGFQSSQSDRVHVGLDQGTQVDTLEVTWPSGLYQRLTNIRADQLLTLQEAQAHKPPPVRSVDTRPRPTLFQDATDEMKLTFIHRENSFEEFNAEPLLPHRFSRQGPCLAAGDVNGDGLDDFFMGGPAHMAGSLFIQQTNGTFRRSDMPDPGYEDTGALFFDADGDRDLDLYVVSGGNEYNPQSAPYQDRLYRNDGRGHFSYDRTAVPVEVASGSCVVSADYDRDGDLDLFVGGRVVPTRYPLPAESLLLRNDGKGHFVNVTRSECPALQTLGLVTAAQWTDLDGDGWIDLVIAGEWMPVMWIKNTRSRMTAAQPIAVTAGSVPTGWWFSLAAADVDRDGDMDLIAGNVGTNSRLRASAAQPVRMYAKDFDQNGTVESILTHYVNQAEYPYHSRDALASQYPLVKKRMATYRDFAQTTVDNLFASDEQEGALVLTATEFRSMYFENQDKGPNGMPLFQTEPLPLPVQFAPVQAIVVSDVNHDGYADVLAAGNWFDPELSTGRFDAGGLWVLLNATPSNHKTALFTAFPKASIGPTLRSDVRSMSRISVAGNSMLLLGSNAGCLIGLKEITPQRPVKRY